MPSDVIQGFFPGGRLRMATPKASAIAQLRATATSARRVGPPSAATCPRPARYAQRVAASPVAQPTADRIAVDPLALRKTGPGRALPEAVRAHMEQALGADFRDVRVHVGPQAESIGAIAFTTGADIYFAPGRFNPDTAEGRRLLGHELAHVIQQRQGRVRGATGALTVVQDAALEAEADRAGMRAGMGSGRSFAPVQAKMVAPFPSMMARRTAFPATIQMKCKLCNASSHKEKDCPKRDMSKDAPPKASGRGLTNGSGNNTITGYFEACIDLMDEKDKWSLCYGHGGKSIVGGRKGIPTNLKDKSARIDRQGEGNVQFQTDNASYACVVFDATATEAQIKQGLIDSFKSGAIKKL